jgi:hypothetical protein
MLGRPSSLWIFFAACGSFFALAAPGCSSEEFHANGSGGKSDAGSDATAGGTGGTSTAGGTGGTSASGGTGGNVGCTSDAECDDGKGCNGKETCKNGACVAGAPVECTNPDAAHCSASCEEGAGGTTKCVIQGRDADGDLHLDAACAPSSVTADDCDDSNKTVYPGAQEICDGLDNDCNGKDELDEGMALGGGVADLVKGNFSAQDVAVAWSPAGKTYGVVWIDDHVNGLPQVYFSLMSVTGAKTGTQLPLSLGGTGAAAPRMAWGNGAFGIVWQDLQSKHIMFARVAADGTQLGGPKIVTSTGAAASEPDVVATAGGWVVVWSDARTLSWGTLYARPLAADGTPAGTKDTPVGEQIGSNHFPRAATDGTTILVTYANGATSTADMVKSLQLSTSLVASDEKILSASPKPNGVTFLDSSVASTGSGWALAWRRTGTSEKLDLFEQAANGTSLCVPTSIDVPAGGVPGSIAARGDARIVSFGYDISVLAEVRLMRFKKGCATPVIRTLSTGEIPTFEPRGTELAWSDNGVAVLWTDWGTGRGVIRRWVSGPNLCDAPIP